MSEANKQVALEFVRAMGEGDAAALERCLAPDAETVTKGFAGVSGRRSREMMIATTAAFRQLIPTGFREKILRVIGEGDTVLVEFEGNAVLSNGEPYCNQYAFVFTFENGRIRRLDEYFCTALADRTILPLLAQQGEGYAHGDA
jgi:ketosteroid isomerase-like protein